MPFFSLIYLIKLEIRKKLERNNQQKPSRLLILSYHSLHMRQYSGHCMYRRHRTIWIREKRELCRFRMSDSISCLSSTTGARKYHAFQFRIVIVYRDVIVF